MNSRYDVLLHRHESNPILTANDWPYPVHTVFNPGATRLQDGTTLLLCRVEDRRGISHFCAARSEDGITDWRIDERPTFVPDPSNYPEEIWGIEDPRITYLAEEDVYVIAYTAFGRSGPAVSLAKTKDFVEFERLGLVMGADDKDAALLPRKVNGEYALVHRPITDEAAHIWISYSPDLTFWGEHKIMLHARKGAYWDANKIGLSPPLVETERGWLVVYHGVRRHASGSIYRLGLALMDKNSPEIVLRRGEGWMMAPTERYEIEGDVPYVVFPCGFTVLDDGDTIRFYYGAADTCIGMCEGSIQQMLDWLENESDYYEYGSR
jgi:predicted GH43/DUF377 family glycosyl hydrolase